jgi:hypothetical protein
MGTCAAGSNEHVFPAALGGRRTNRQIYCTFHNNEFGRHVAVLEKQLSMMNAQIGIRPDRHDHPKPFFYTSPNGEEYSILGPKIEETMPALDLENLPIGEKISLDISSMDAFERLRERAKEEHGLDLRIVSQGPTREVYTTESLNINLSFGGKPGLQAVAYLALTFFAQYYPNESRLKSLERVKEFLLKDYSKDTLSEQWPEDIAWWDSRDPEDVVGKNPFRFGHTVAVGFSSTTQHAYAYISFFSLLNCNVDLGHVNATQDNAVVVFINPEADRPPHDILVKHFTTCIFQTEPADNWFENMMASGVPSAAMERFLTKVEEKHLFEFVDGIKSKFNELSLENHESCLEVARLFTNSSGQRILRLLSKASTDLASFLSNQIPENFLDALRKAVTPDKSQEKGLSPGTLALLEKTEFEIANEIAHELSKRPPNFDNIAMLLGGGLGIVTTIKKVLLPLIFEKITQGKSFAPHSGYNISYKWNLP